MQLWAMLVACHNPGIADSIGFRVGVLVLVGRLVVTCNETWLLGSTGIDYAGGRSHISNGLLIFPSHSVAKIGLQLLMGFLISQFLILVPSLWEHLLTTPSVCSTVFFRCPLIFEFSSPEHYYTAVNIL